VRLFSFQFLKVVFFLLVLCALLPVRSVFAITYPENVRNESFTNLSTRDGLSQSYVFDVVQDENGFIWIATQDGLNRYDGIDFKHYRTNIQDPNSVADNFIRNLFIDSKNRLWIGTANGVSLYLPETDNFKNFRSGEGSNTLVDNMVWSISENKKKEVIVTTENGFHKFDEQESQLNRRKIGSLNNKISAIKTIYQDHKLNYWLGTHDNGIYIVNDSLTTSVSLSESNGWKLKIPATALNKIEEIDDDYWLATNNGLYIVNKDYKVKNHFIFSDEENAKDNYIRDILSANNGDIWLATDNGIKILNLLSGNWKEFKNSPGKNTSLSDNHIFALFEDENNSIWISTYSGISVYKPAEKLIQSSREFKKPINNYVDSMAFHSGELFFVHGGVLYKGQQKPKPVTLPASASILSVASSGVNLIVTSHAGELFIRDEELGSFVEVVEWKKDVQQELSSKLLLTNNKVYFIDVDARFKYFDLQSRGVTKYDTLEDKKVSALAVDEDKNIWLSTYDNKILRFQSGKIQAKFTIAKEINFPFEQVRSISSMGDWLLLGSRSHGAILFNKNSEDTTFFNEKMGLGNNFITDIVSDNNGTFWLSTNDGISAIEPKTKKLRNYSRDFGLLQSEYLTNSGTLSPDKIIYFGGINGFDYFSPSELSATEQKINKPIFTNFLIANKKVDIGIEKENNTRFKLSKPLSRLSKLELSYKDSPFSIEFIAPNTKLINQVKYKYRLVGLDESWIETDSSNRRATYTYPSSGNYTFEVTAYDKYNPNIAASNKINIYVRPPWWLSSNAILLYGLVVLLILAYILQQIRHKRLYHMQIKQSEERLKLSLWGSGDEMWDWNIKSSKIYRSNIWGILDFPQDGTRNVGGGGETNIHENDNTRIREALQEHIDGNSEHFEVTYRVKDKNGQWIWVLDRGKIVERNDKGQPIRMTGTLKDISQIKRADERLKLFAKCIENISDAVVIYDRKFTIVDVNKAFQRITGKNKQQMIGTQMKFSRYADKFLQAVKFHLLNKGSWHGEIESRRANGEVYLTDLNIDIIRDESGNISHFVGVFSDITKRKETEQELRRLANSDTLTGLPNRSYFQANQAKLVKNKTPHALLVFDLDNFKKVNDSMGHEVGDALLCRVANRIRNIGRKQDTVYRLGGDEFSIIIEDTNDIHTITTIAKNILKTIAEPLKLKSQEIVLYSSIGIVLYPEDGASPQELLKNADTAMYHAKNSGGNKYQFFSESMNKQAVKRLQIESLIRHGLKEDNFSVFYQPKIEISTGKIAGMEALVRFETPSKGIISPAVFIPVSEETGQIIDIGEVVLRKACFATKKWVDSGLFDGRIAVNLSAVQFTQPNLVGMISDILHESQLPAKYLELEITEGTVMDSPQQAIDTMLQIRSMGIHLSLDDFGTGYSSLAYLKKFPLNTLKIDKAFVDDIETSEQGRNMVATIVTIAHNLGLHVVAEGVETNQQLSFLAGLRCEQLQGYLYSKPLAESAFQSYLLSHQITDKSTSFTKSDS